MKTRALRLALLAPLALWAPAARAAVVPRLVRDIDPTSYAGSSSPRQLVFVNHGFAFTAFHDRELWIYDERDDVYSRLLQAEEIRQIASIDYAARDKAGAWTLWRVQGFPYFSATRISRRPLRRLGAVHPDPNDLAAPLFEADAGHGRGIWTLSYSDGWQEIAHPLPFPDGSLLRDFQTMDRRGQIRLLFVARHPTLGTALWVAGPAGTFPVFAPKPGQDAPLHLAGPLQNGRLLLTVSGGDPELWTADTTPRGTRPLLEIVKGPGGATVRDAVVLQGRAFLVIDDGRHGARLWTSDGTAAGTRALRTLAFAAAPFGTLPPVAVGPRLLFFADDGVHGRELWASDGTAAGTHLVADLCPGPCGTAGTLHRGLDTFLPTPRPAVFSVTLPSQNTELWASDGTAAGTIRLAALCTAPCDAAPRDFASTYFLSAPDRELTFTAATTAGPRALWRTDGTPEGTFRVTPPGVVATTGLFDEGYFAASDPDFGDELWQTDGTPETTHLAVDLERTQDSGSYPGIVGTIGTVGTAGEAGRLLLTAFDPQHGRQLWTSDGTAAGTSLLPTFPGRLNWSASPGVRLGARTVFLGTPVDSQTATLWASDGTTAGTVPLLPPGVLVSSPPYPADSTDPTKHRAVFLAEDAAHGQDLWATDGTPESTVCLDLAPGPASLQINFSTLASLRGALLFQRFDDDEHVWRTDGTAAGTRRLVDLDPLLAPLDRLPALVLVAETPGKIFFTGTSGVPGDPTQLWVSDGTPAGTRSLGAPAAGAVTALYAAGPKVFFLTELGDNDTKDSG